MTEPEAGSLRVTLRSALAQALKQRDRPAIAVYRAALGAIDNAEAVPAGNSHRVGAIESSPVGVGRADTPRRALTEPAMREIVAGEARERCSVAELLQTAEPEAAEQLRAEARMLLSLLGELAAE